MPLLEVRKLSKSFTAQRAAVDNVSFTIEESEIVCLLGPSGCGKTTLLRLIAGLDFPDVGEICFDGQRMNDVPPHLREFGMMFQEFALFPHKSVAANVAFGLQMKGQSPGVVEQRVDEMLTLVDLAGFHERNIDLLSGGEQQRVALARSLAPEPRLLMLDEPLGSLDRALRERLMLEVREILKRMGMTAIYVTHDQTEAFAIADRIVVMNSGRIEQLDKPQNIFEHPQSVFVARFLGFQNVLCGAVERGGVRTAIGLLQIAGLPPDSGQEVTVLVRPDAVDDDGDLIVEGTLVALSYRGKYYKAWFDVHGQTLVFELKERPGRPGEQLSLAIRSDHMQLLAA